MYIHQQGVDGTTPSGKAMLGMAAVFAEFERACTVERIHAGLGRARAQGKRLGRPPVGGGTEAEIKRLRAGGMGKVKIARTVRCGVSTVSRVLRDTQSGIA